MIINGILFYKFIYFILNCIISHPYSFYFLLIIYLRKEIWDASSSQKINRKFTKATDEFNKQTKNRYNFSIKNWNCSVIYRFDNVSFCAQDNPDSSCMRKEREPTQYPCIHVHYIGMGYNNQININTNNEWMSDREETSEKLKHWATTFCHCITCSREIVGLRFLSTQNNNTHTHTK